MFNKLQEKSKTKFGKSDCLDNLSDEQLAPSPTLRDESKVEGLSFSSLSGLALDPQEFPYKTRSAYLQINLTKCGFRPLISAELKSAPSLQPSVFRTSTMRVKGKG